MPPTAWRWSGGGPPRAGQGRGSHASLLPDVVEVAGCRLFLAQRRPPAPGLATPYARLLGWLPGLSRPVPRDVLSPPPPPPNWLKVRGAAFHRKLQDKKIKNWKKKVTEVLCV